MTFLGFFKRGNVQDLAFVIGVAVFLVISIVFGTMILSKFNDKIQNTDAMPTIAKDISNDYRTGIPSILDKFFLIIIIVLFIGAVVSAWFIDTTPAFFVLSIILLIVVHIAVAIMQNYTENLIESDKISAYALEYPIMVWYTQHMFVIGIVMGAILLIALYGKSRVSEY
jgi:hypothetical protein